MLLIVGTVRLPPHRLASALPVMRRMVDASRAEDGCVDYAYAEDLFDRGLIHVRELWVDQPALDRHFASDHLTEWRSAWAGLEIGERTLRLYEVGEARPT